MFDGIASRYDLLNTLISLGLDRRWRREALRAATAGLPPGRPILDLGCGTGDLCLGLAKASPNSRAVGLDPSLGMLSVAQGRLDGALGAPPSAPRPALVAGSAFHLPFDGGAFGAAVSAFVLRNLRDLPAAFAELGRVVASGGRIVLLDITEPASPLLRRGFDLYFGAVAPALGSLVGRRGEYSYLVRSLAHLPSATDLCATIRRAGFERVRARPLDGGMVTLYLGVRGTEGGDG